MARAPNYGQERKERDRQKAAKKAEKQAAKVAAKERSKPEDETTSETDGNGRVKRIRPGGGSDLA
ncbi:MAG: hypothetical protein EOS26_24505 [Mesorhizobium sp.]|nr:MAG: hypothetical protein EOS26_24505 [Mesorhizobium sp.]